MASLYPLKPRLQGDVFLFSRRVSAMFGLLLDSWILHPWKVTWQRKNTTIWSCISYSKWWFSVAVFVFQACGISFLGLLSRKTGEFESTPSQVSSPLPNDNNWWLTYKYHLPGRLGRMMIFPFLKGISKGTPILFAWKKQQPYAHFTKTWGEAKHDRMLVETWWFPQGGFCGGYDPGDSLVCHCGLETLR